MLAAKSWRLFRPGWRQRLCGENYNAETGAIRDQPDTDAFYSWGALLPALAAAEQMDFTPWSGWSVMGPPPGTHLGPLLTPLGPCFLRAGNHDWRLEHTDGRVLLETSLAGRIAELSLDGPAVAALLPPIDRDDVWIAFPDAGLTRGRLEGRVLEARDGRFALPANPEAARFTGA